MRLSAAEVCRFSTAAVGGRALILPSEPRLWAPVLVWSGHSCPLPLILILRPRACPDNPVEERRLSAA
jgi:hypothetical protein